MNGVTDVESTGGATSAKPTVSARLRFSAAPVTVPVPAVASRSGSGGVEGAETTARDRSSGETEHERSDGR
jgi:hypothetical protein